MRRGIGNSLCDKPKRVGGRKHDTFRETGGEKKKGHPKRGNLQTN